MKLNRDVIVQAIIEEKEHFLRFLDHINTHDTGGEIPKTRYIKYFEQVIRNNPTKSHLLQVLSLESLIDNGIFVHDSPLTGNIAFNKLILDLLSFLDTKRSKQLFSTEFEDMRERTIRNAKEIKSLPVGSVDQNEAIATFKNLLIEINTKVRENISVLQSKAEEFAEEYKNFEAGDSILSINDLYSKVDTLFHRNVRPFLDFTTTDQIVVGQSFLDALLSLIAYFEGQNNLQMARNLSFRKTAITSYYKDIRKISDRLRVYLNQLGKDKSNFMAIENAYAQLIQALNPLRHGGSRNIKLKPDASFFTDLPTFDGLSDHKSKYGAKLNLKPENNLFRFQLNLERVNAKPLKSKEGHLKPLPAASYVELDRQMDIARLIYQLKHPLVIEDVFFYTHIALQQGLQDFSLKDTLFGIEVILPQLNQHLKTTNQRSKINDDQYYLDYSVLKYCEEHHHG